MIQIRQMLTPANTPARCGYSLRANYVTIHNTANLRATATADAHGRYLQGSGSQKEVSYHYVVDEDEIVQCIPDSEVAWHAGDGSKGVGNRQSIAIEICENDGANLYAATQRAAELTAYLMEKHNISIENVVQHNHWSGKNCPNRIRKGEPYGWGQFIANVKKAQEDAADKGESDEGLQEWQEKLNNQAKRIKLLEDTLDKIKAVAQEVKP